MLQVGARSYGIRWDDHEMIYEYPRPSVYRICNNCDMTYEDHAKGGKCLYSPTSWS